MSRLRKILIYLSEKCEIINKDFENSFSNSLDSIRIVFFKINHGIILNVMAALKIQCHGCVKNSEVKKG